MLSKKRAEDLVRPPFFTIMGLYADELNLLWQIEDDRITEREKQLTITGWQLTFHFKTRADADAVINRVRNDLVQFRSKGR